MPRISVVLPVYNGAAFLEEAVQSILPQTFKDFELLALDDGSTNQSRAILERFAARDSRVQVISRPNKGLVHTLNEGIERASGIYIARMDSDDISVPERLERQVGYLQKNLDCVLIGSSVTTIDNEGRPIFDILVPDLHQPIEERHLSGITKICHPSAMMRRDAVITCGGYDPSFVAAEDLDLWLRMGEIGRVANLPEILLKYCIHQKSVSSSRRDLQRESAYRACESAWRRRKLPAVDFEFEGRPAEDSLDTRRETFLRYGWQAWSNGYRGTWRYYALRSISLAPLSIRSWILLAFGALTRPAATRRKAGE